MTTITIDPVTRIEGHGKVIISIDAAGAVQEASFQTVEFRGFEKFCEGRMVWDMPTLTSRICGFCPVSHHLASVKACEASLGVEPPPAASMLRELLLLGQFIQSHALHYFFCAMPDFLGVEPKDRNAFAMLNANSEAAQKAVKLRRIGQDIVDKVGGGRLHPVTCIPGGMSKHLEYLDRVELLKGVLQGLSIAKLAVKNVKALYAANKKTFDTFAAFPSRYVALSASGQLRLYDGTLRVVDEAGAVVSDVAPRDYASVFEEQSASDSYSKTIFLKGQKDAVYRVGPLARANIAASASTPIAEAELAEFKQLGAGKPVAASLFYHYARMIELLYAVERAGELLRRAEILSADVRVSVKRGAGEGVGVIEAPRGTLIHHYITREDGRVTHANLVVATSHNKLAMNKSVARVAQTLVQGGTIDEGQLGFIEMAIRCYDPCLSCSTHAFGKMPLDIEIRDATGETRAAFRRGGT